MKRFLSVLISICLLIPSFGAAGAENEPGFFESLGVWADQAWKDASAWALQAWKDARAWMDQAWGAVPQVSGNSSTPLRNDVVFGQETARLNSFG